MKQLVKRALVHRGFHRYLANTSWLFAEQVLRLIAGLLVGVWVARYLGPEKFGLLNYSLAFVALFAAFSKLGLDGIVVRELVNAPERRDACLGTAFWLKVAGAFVSVSVIAVAVMLSGNDNTTKLYIGLIACGLIFQSFEVVDFYFQSRVISRYVSLCKISQLFISSILKLYFVAIQADLFWFVLISLVDQVSLAGALVYAYARQHTRMFYFKFDLSVARELLMKARPLIISGMIVSVYTSIDRILIKELLGVKEVGLYIAATGLTGALYFIPSLIGNSLFPAILNAKKVSVDVYNRRLTLIYRYMLAVGLLSCILVTYFALDIIRILYGSQFSESSAVLQIHIWNFLVISFSVIFGKWLLAENLQHISLNFNLMAMVVNILGCLILIPLWSIKGAALAALLAQVIPLIWFGFTNKEIKSQLGSVFSYK